MADNPSRGKEEAEEEEEQEGKATEYNVNGTQSPSRNASRAGSDPSKWYAAPALPMDSVPQILTRVGSNEASKNVSARTVDRTGGAITATEIPSKTPSSATPSRGIRDLSRNSAPQSLPKAPVKSLKDTGQVASAPQAPGVGSSRLFERRSPFVHNPPYPEERRPRISNPQCPRDYIINLREDLADFQESHGLPRTRDYSFLSLGLSLAQETGRAIYSIFLMITELFPVIVIVSLILKFSLDKLIEILETDGTTARVKKSVIFAFQILIIMIPLWILVGTIIIPLFCLILSIFRRLFRVSGRTKGKPKTAARPLLSPPPPPPPPPPAKGKK